MCICIAGEVAMNPKTFPLKHGGGSGGENVKNRNIRTFLISLFISSTFGIIFYAYFIRSLDALSGFLIWVGLPIFILYIMGYVVLRVEEKKGNIVGWIMISYTFLYLMYLTVYIALADIGPATHSLSYVFIDIAFILGLSAMWYGFNVPIFWEYKMKKHLYGACLSIMIIIGVFLCGVVMY